MLTLIARRYALLSIALACSASSYVIQPDHGTAEDAEVVETSFDLTVLLDRVLKDGKPDTTRAAAAGVHRRELDAEARKYLLRYFETNRWRSFPKRRRRRL